MIRNPSQFSGNIALLLTLLVTGPAASATSCWISTAPTEFSATYSATGNVSSTNTATVRCKTESGTQIVNFSLTPNDGLNPSGSQNRATLGSSLVNYDLYTTASTTCTTQWTGFVNSINANIAGRTKTATFRRCVKATTPAPSAGYHTDTQTLTLAITSPPGVLITGPSTVTFPVNIGVPLSCQISTPPANIDFGTYTAFSPSPRTTSTSFNVRCTSANQGLTMDVGNTYGVVPNTGLNYSLAINTSASASGASNPFESNSNATAGATKTFYIIGTMPAGQAGTCPTGSCVGSDTRTLTVTY